MLGEGVEGLQARLLSRFNFDQIRAVVPGNKTRIFDAVVVSDRPFFSAAAGTGPWRSNFYRRRKSKSGVRHDGQLPLRRDKLSRQKIPEIVVHLPLRLLLAHPEPVLLMVEPPVLVEDLGPML